MFAWRIATGKRAIRAIGAGLVSGTKPVGDHETTGSEQSDERNAIECGILILGNEMRSLRHGLRHEKMIEGIAVMKRKSRTSDKMRICNI